MISCSCYSLFFVFVSVTMWINTQHVLWICILSYPKVSLDFILSCGHHAHEYMPSLFLNVICRIFTKKIECVARKGTKTERDLQSFRSFKSLKSFKSWSKLFPPWKWIIWSDKISLYSRLEHLFHYLCIGRFTSSGKIVSFKEKYVNGKRCKEKL